MKKSLVVAAVLAAFGTAAVAELSANVALTTKYKFRGQDQSDATEHVVPALQGGFDYTMGNFYLGNWNSGIGFAHGTEMNFYGGYKGEAGGLGYDVGVLQYYYPGSGVSNLNTTEIYGALTFGPVTAKVSGTASKRYFGLDEGRGTVYADLTARWPLMPKLTLDAHLGYTRFTDDTKALFTVENYADYKLGVSYDLGSGFSVSAAAVGANKRSVFGDANKSRLVATLSKTL